MSKSDFPEPPEFFDPHGGRGLMLLQKGLAWRDECVHKAILAERERCARICDDLESSDEEGWANAASFIGATILKG